MARRPRPPDDPGGLRHLIELVRTTVPPMHHAGVPFVAGALGVAALGRRQRWLRGAGLLAAGASAGFFRHPPRVPPTRPGVVVAPADGMVCLVDTATPPPELELPDTPLPRVSIFMSVFDAHVQRAPVGGEVLDVRHRAGQFGSADRAEASEDNERNSVRIRTADGAEVIAVQIAGLVARRIVCDTRPGDRLAIGDTYGLIRFGSRLDTYMPVGTQPLVGVGQRMIAGETVLAQLP
ncbi:phosphatidylserine decarboxylase [Mycolicibacter sinensis]|uniref:Phosphatidylserine decarboxylase proenzyme n=1 Tax=Mycolicibacter sinensis (strain JDM601) TaxID=875328 RepID=A0A1A3U5R5_MYCSD|nr:phosphatidylserine decarboxylase [Mycolicibacter sinensis]OBK90245.1 phosphatidylserine decarboxylase [Mycolicibacter sinensis]